MSCQTPGCAQKRPLTLLVKAHSQKECSTPGAAEQGPKSPVQALGPILARDQS